MLPHGDALALDSPRWAAFQLDYGAGRDIPLWIAGLERGAVDLGPAPRGFNPAYLAWILAALCTDAFVFAGGVAAAPHLVRIARSACPRVQAELLLFVGSTRILDRASTDPELERCLAVAQDEARELALASLSRAGTEANALRLLAAVACLEERAPIAYELVGLCGADGSLLSARCECPRCGYAVELLHAGDGFMLEHPAPAGARRRRGLEPADLRAPDGPPAATPPRAKDAAAARLGALAERAHQPALAARLRKLLAGRMRCAGCGELFAPWQLFLEP